MRIGIDCRALQEPQPSGVSVYTRRIVEELLQLPQTREHTFVLFFNGSSLLGEGELADFVRRTRYELQDLRERSGGARLEFRVRLWPGKLLKVTQVVFDWPRIKWMFGDVDKVFLPSFKFFPVRDASIPYVLTVHDLSFERYPEYFNMRRRLWHWFLQPRKMVQRAKRVIAVSEHTKHDIVELFEKDAEAVQVVHSGIDGAANRSNSDGSGRGGSRVERRGRTFVSLSTIEPRKNIETLLDAFERVREQLPGARLVVAGGAGWNSEELLERMQKQDGVEYRGYISEQEKIALLQEAAAFVYPSFYEGFGFPPLEAQLHGVPVIVGAHSSLPEVLGESALYADVLDITSLTRAMNAVITDDALRSKMIEKGYNNAARFDWTQSAKQVWDVLNT